MSGHECVPNSLGPGSPSFKLWRFSELPEEWQRGPGQAQLANAAGNTGIPVHAVACYTAVVLPDTGFGRHYYAWAVQQLEAASSGADLLPVMLSAQDDYRGLADRAARMQEMEVLLQALLLTGKPPAHFTKVFSRRG